MDIEPVDRFQFTHPQGVRRRTCNMLRRLCARVRLREPLFFEIKYLITPRCRPVNILTMNMLRLARTSRCFHDRFRFAKRIPCSALIHGDTTPLDSEFKVYFRSVCLPSSAPEVRSPGCPRRTTLAARGLILRLRRGNRGLRGCNRCALAQDRLRCRRWCCLQARRLFLSCRP